jgi:hypothetical protein
MRVISPTFPLQDSNMNTAASNTTDDAACAQQPHTEFIPVTSPTAMMAAIEANDPTAMER